MLSKSQLISNGQIKSFSFLFGKLISNITLHLCGFQTPNSVAHNPSERAALKSADTDEDFKLVSEQIKHTGRVGRPVKISPFFCLRSLLLMGLSGAETLGHFMRVNMARQFDMSKSHAYRFIDDSGKNWRRLVQIVSKTALRILKRSYPDDPFNAFIVDDTVYHRRRAKFVELSCRLHDHVSGRNEKGFTLLNLAMGNSSTALPIDSLIVSSSKKSKQIREAKANTDYRSHGGKAKELAQKTKFELTYQMIRDAIKRGYKAKYVLMDSWFGCNNTLIYKLHDMGLHVVAMNKDFSQRFRYNDKIYYLDDLRRLVKPTDKKSDDSPVIGYLTVCCEPTKSQLRNNPDIEPLPVKLLWLKAYKGDKELCIITTETEATEEQIIQTYSNRFNIEENFFNLKHFLHMESGSRARNFDTVRAHIALCLLRLLMLTILKCASEKCSFGDMVYNVGEEVKVKPLSKAIEQIFANLMKLPDELIKKGCIVKGKEKETWEAFLKTMSKCLNGLSEYVLGFIEGITKLLGTKLRYLERTKNNR